MERLTVAYGPRGLDRVTVPSKRGSRVAAAVDVARLDCIVWPIVWVRAVCAATVHDSYEAQAYYYLTCSICGHGQSPDLKAPPY